MTNSNDDLDKYADDYDNSFRVRPRLRSLISRGSKPVKKEIFDEDTGEWRTVIRMSRDKFDDEAKARFLAVYGRWGRMGEAASAAGVTSQTVRKALEDDEDFAEAMMVQEEEYTTKLIGHHQDLLFNGVEKNRYDKDGNLIESSRDYPIKLIEMELKKHDEGYRDKREVKMDVTGGVLVAPAEVDSVDDWEKRFSNAVDVTPGDEDEKSGDKVPLLGQ